MQFPNSKTDLRQYIKVCGILTLIIILIGVFLSWFNTGDVLTGLHIYGSAIIVMVIGIWLLFHASGKANMVGGTMLTVGLVYLLMGIKLG